MNQAEVEKYLAYKVIAGSKAYGLDLPTSDTDIRGIYILPNEYLMGLGHTEQVNNVSNDIVYYELNRFVALLSQNNPNIIEELFGEIEDEHDNDITEIEEQIEEGEYRFSARLEVAYLNEAYKLNLPESDSYSTLGGLIVDQSEEIPQKGDLLSIEGFQVQIEAASNRKIEVVRLSVLQRD